MSSGMLEQFNGRQICLRKTWFGFGSWVKVIQLDDGQIIEVPL